MFNPIFQIIIPTIAIPLLLYLYWRLRLKKLAEYNSKRLGKIEVFEKYNKERVLTINSYTQGISIEDKSIKQSYWYDIANKAVNHTQGKKSAKILMLGLGANTMSNLIAQKNPKISQTIIEIDSFIIQACKDFFHLNELPNYKLIQADAYKLLSSKNPFPNKFDVVIVDIFIGSLKLVPNSSGNPEFITQLIQHLKKDGLIIFNRPGDTQKARAASKELTQFLSTHFEKTGMKLISDPRRFKNHVIIGSIKK